MCLFTVGKDILWNKRSIFCGLCLFAVGRSEGISTEVPVASWNTLVECIVLAWAIICSLGRGFPYWDLMMLFPGTVCTEAATVRVFAGSFCSKLGQCEGRRTVKYGECVYMSSAVSCGNRAFSESWTALGHSATGDSRHHHSAEEVIRTGDLGISGSWNMLRETVRAVTKWEVIRDGRMSDKKVDINHDQRIRNSKFQKIKTYINLCVPFKPWLFKPNCCKFNV